MEQKYTRGVSWSTFEPTGKLGYCYLYLPSTHNNISTNRSFLLASVLGLFTQDIRKENPIVSLLLTMGF